MATDPGATEPNLRTDNAKIPIDTVRPPLKPGASFKGFEVLEVLGQGGMGVVYKARQQSLNRLVALKLLNSQLATSEEFAARFDREAKVLASLNHPNVVQVFDFGKEDGLLYLVMEHVDGPTLESVMKSKKQEPLKFLAAVRDVARGLERVHEAGLVHRDIKPSNILMAKDGTAKISDFGLAIETEGTQKLTQSGMFVGTPHYVSPEHAQGKKVDGRSDLYSLGVILFEGYAGRPPFQAPSATAILLKHVNEAPPALYKLAPQAPKTVQEIVRRLLAKNPAARYDTAAALVRDLERAVEEGKSGPKAPATARKVPAPAPAASKLPLKWIAAGAAAAVALIAIVAIALSGKTEPPKKEEKTVAVTRTVTPEPKREAPKETAEPAPAPVTPAPTPAPAPVTPEPRTPSAVEEAFRQADKLFEQARAAYEDGKARNSVEALTDAGFKADEARSKYAAVQEIGSDELKAKAVEQVKLVQQFQKLVNESRLAIQNAKGVNPAPTPIPAAPVPNPAPAPGVAPGPRPLPAAPAPAARRAALPNATVQKDSEKQIRTLFKDDYARKAPADVQSLARKLLEQGSSVTNDDGARYVLLRDARDLAAQVGDLDVAMKAVDAMALSFELEPVSTKVAALNKAAPQMRGADGMAALAKAYLAVMEEGIASGQYDPALTVTSKAETAARAAKDEILISRTVSVAKDLSFLQRESAAVRTAAKTLEQKPDDAAANATVGRFTCLAANDWARGTALLAKGNDPLLKAAAEKEIAAVDDTSSQAAVGDAWWVAAEKERSPEYKKREQARAVKWYLDALPGLAGLAKLQAETRLKQVGGLLLPAQPLPQRTEVVGGTGGASYDDYSREGGVLIGLRMSWSSGGVVLKAVQPLFSTTSSVQEGPVRGKTTSGFKESMAKPGYAVGGLIARGTNRVNGLKIVYMKISGIALDPRDSYESEWFGDRGSGEVRLGGDGTYVLGLCGGAFEDVDSLGLLVLRRGEGRGTPAAAPAPAPASGIGAPAPKGTIDLLALVDPAKDAVEGQWRFDEKVLVASAGDHVRLMLPYLPPDEYDLRIVMERRDGNDGVVFGLARGTNQWTVYVDKLPTEGYQSGTELVDTQMLTALRGPQLTTGQPATFDFKVRRSGFTVVKDGKTLYTWQGNTNRLGNYQRWAVPNPRALFIGEWWNQVRYSEIRLTPISGEGTYLRGGPPPKNAVDLLALIDPKQDAVKGDWTTDGQGLICSAGDHIRLQIPYSPPEEYDLVMTVDRRDGSDGLLVGLVKGSAQWSVTMDTQASGAYKSGFELLDNQGPSGNATTYSSQVFTNGVETTLEFRVRKAGVTVLAGGKPIIDWRGAFNRLSLPDGWKVRNSNALFLAAWGSRYHFSRIYLVPISAQGAVLRKTPAPAAKNGIDLLALVQPQRDGIKGDWTKDNGVLVAPGDTAWARLQIPFAPPAEYDLTLAVERRAGEKSFVVGIVWGGRPATIVIDGDAPGSTYASGLDNIGGKRFSANETMTPGRFLAAGKPSVVAISVRKGSVALSIDGQPLFDWKGEPGRVTIHDGWKVPLSEGLMLGCYETQFSVQQMSLVPVTGAGRKLR
ncbi:MAG: protein kinase [Planctomycetes bacterium]|nr:protein kinase [Planctomycetota bacterium]